MLKINILCVGKIKESFLKDAICEYEKRLSKAVKLNIIELEEGNANSPVNIIVEQECKKILNHIKGYVILLDIKGKNIKSEELSSLVFDRIIQEGYSEISFVIGGSYGTNNQLQSIANYRLSFGNMTFPHQLMRVILLEQIYRAYTISINSPYHK